MNALCARWRGDPPCPASANNAGPHYVRSLKLSDIEDCFRTHMDPRLVMKHSA